MSYQNLNPRQRRCLRFSKDVQNQFGLTLTSNLQTYIASERYPNGIEVSNSATGYLSLNAMIESTNGSAM